jgi:Flp pilus assembly protein TadD
MPSTKTQNYRPFAAVALILSLSACNGVDSTSSFGNHLSTVDIPEHVEPYPDNQVLMVAKAKFSEGSYGYAARYYERAVEIAPGNGEAWLGLAASYDRVRRFDLADRAYREAARYVGGTIEYLNNLGYSYLLRGDVSKAYVEFQRAHQIDPNNVTINNNLAMIRSTLTQRSGAGS